MPHNVLNLPLHDDDAAFFLEYSMPMGSIPAGMCYMIGAGCNKTGAAAEFVVCEDGQFLEARIARRTGRNSVNMTDMGVRQRERAETFLRSVGAIT